MAKRKRRLLKRRMRREDAASDPVSQGKRARRQARRNRKRKAGKPGQAITTPGAAFGNQPQPLTPLGDDVWVDPLDGAGLVPIPGTELIPEMYDPGSESIDPGSSPVWDMEGEISVDDIQRMMLQTGLGKKQRAKLKRMLKQALRREKLLGKQALKQAKIDAKTTRAGFKNEKLERKLDKKTDALDRVRGKLQDAEADAEMFGGFGGGLSALDTFGLDPMAAMAEDGGGMGDMFGDVSPTTWWIAGGIGAAALAAFALTGRKKKRGKT